MAKPSKRKPFRTFRRDGSAYCQDRMRPTPGGPEHRVMLDRIAEDVEREKRMKLLRGDVVMDATKHVITLPVPEEFLRDMEGR